MSNARVTLADWISDVACPLGFVHATRMSDLDYADTILAALDAAGFEIIHKRNSIHRKHDDLIEQWKRQRPDAAKETT